MAFPHACDNFNHFHVTQRYIQNLGAFSREMQRSDETDAIGDTRWHIPAIDRNVWLCMKSTSVTLPSNSPTHSAASASPAATTVDWK